MCKQTCKTCKCKNKDSENTVDTIYKVDYDESKWKGLIPSTTCPHNLSNKNKEE
jgi:hypothetical protein